MVAFLIVAVGLFFFGEGIGVPVHAIIIQWILVAIVTAWLVMWVLAFTARDDLRNKGGRVIFVTWLTDIGQVWIMVMALLNFAIAPVNAIVRAATTILIIAVDVGLRAYVAKVQR